MRIGSPARALAWILAHATALAVLSACPIDTFGQAPPGAYRAPGPLDPYGHPMVDGARCYNGNCPPPVGFNGPYPMGLGGTDPPVGYDLMNDVGMAGAPVDQRGPHYFDIRAEAVYLDRDETFGQDINFTSFGVAPVVGPPNIVLNSNQLEFDPEPGFRIIGRCDICPLSVLEFGYMGIYSYDSSASVSSADLGTPNNLFSLFSGFGLDPATVTNVNGPMRETERASQHSISLESDLQTAEISYRRYWVGWIPRVSGTLLAGFRYTKLNEEFAFNTEGSTGEVPASLQYAIDADNDLAGAQIGGDIWIGLTQGLRLGSEVKAGLFANRYELANRVTTNPSPSPVTVPVTPNPTLLEKFQDDQPAFIGEASVDLVADVLPSVSFRVGYEVLFIDSLVLAGENFNSGSPYNQGPVDNGFGPPRVPFLVDDSDLFYHGGHAGIEFVW